MSFNSVIPFVNRYKILKYFSNEIASNLYSTVAIIYSKSGIGKSRLCEEILKDAKETLAKVKISINISKTSNLQDGFYIKQIAKEIHRTSGLAGVISFKKFLEMDSEKDADELLYKIANDYVEKSPLLKNSKEAISKVFGIGDFDSNKIFDSNISESIKLSYRYLEYVCKNNYFIINIENIQSIDATSLELLAKLVDNVDKIYLLLEYTITQNNNTLSINAIENSFNKKADLNIDIKELEQLNENDLIKLLESNNEFLKQYVKRSYKQWDGNLRPFVNLHYKLPDNNEEIKNFVSNSNNIVNNLVLNDIMSLSSKELFLLLLIATHSDPVELNLINQSHNIELHTDVSSIFDFEIELQKLVQKRFLSVYDKTYMINDDTILENLLNCNYFQSKRLLAIQLWLEIYTLIYSGENHYFISRSSLLFNILKFSVQLQEEQKILKHLNELMFLFKNSTPIWVKDWIFKILDSIKMSKNEYINNLIKIRLCEITQNLALYDASYELINSIRTDSPNVLIVKSILLENNSKPDEALKIINSLYEQNIEKRLYLACKISEIAALRSLNEYDKAEKVFKKIIDNNEYKKYLEYGFVLRHAGTIIHDSKKALPYVIQGIEHFKKHGALIQELHSRIEVAVIHIYNEDFEIAEKELEEAYDISKNNFIENYIINNNLAIVYLYQSKNLEKAYSMLKKSLSMVQTPFDKLALHINLLISAHSLQMDKDSILYLCSTMDELCQLNNTTEKEIKRIAYLNLMISCKLLSDEQKFQIYKDRFELIEVEGDRYGQTKKFNQLLNDKLDFSKQQNCVGHFITCELAHWSIEFDSILKSFE